MFIIRYQNCKIISETMKSPKVSIIILNWNGKEDTIECLKSLNKLYYNNYDIILIDNGSIDNSIEYIHQYFPNLKIIENKINLGFAGGNNIGIDIAINNGAEYILLLNNDTIVDPNLLNELINVALSNTKIAFVGSKIYYYDFYGKKNVINYAGGKLCIWRGVARHIGINQIDNAQFDFNKEVDYIEGSCLLVKVDIIKKIGYLNPDMFTYWEDIDWCIRGKKAGYKLLYAYKAKMWHKIGSYKKEKSKKAYYYNGRNIFIIIKQHASLIEKILFFVNMLLIKIPITIIVTVVIHRNTSEAIYYLNGIKDGIGLYIK